MNRVDRRTPTGHRVDPVALLAGTLAELSPKQQKATLDRARRVYVQICLEAYPNMSPEKMVQQFEAIANGSKAWLLEMKAAAASRTVRSSNTATTLLTRC